MKICEILLFGMIVGTEGRKTPFERRLLKTFNILNTWGNQHLAGHEHFLVKLTDKDNKVSLSARVNFLGFKCQINSILRFFFTQKVFGNEIF